MTLLRVYSNADFSAKNVGVIPVEPAIALPSDSLVASFRFAGKASKCLVNEVAGGWGDMYFPAATPVVDSISVTLATTAYMAFLARFPVYPMTIISVYEQPVTPVNHVLGGYSSGGVPELYLTAQSSGNMAAIARKDGATVATATTPNGGARWEMVVGTFNSPANLVGVHRPRTGAKVTSAFSDWAAVTDVYRVGASASPARHARQIIYTRVLSDAEIAAIYVSVRDSMSFAGIVL